MTRRQIIGYVVVGWRGTGEFFLRARRQCTGSSADVAECKHLTFAHLEAHDNKGPEIACSTMTVVAPYWDYWRSFVTPIELHVPERAASR